MDTECKEIVENYSTQPLSYSLASLVNVIESEFAQLSSNTFTYELKPLLEKMASSSSAIDVRDLPIRDYELTCRFTEMNMPVVPPLKMKLSVKYPNEPPEVLSLTSTSLSLTPARLENTGSLTLEKEKHPHHMISLLDGHLFFETISRNFIYFLFKLPAQHTVTDVLDIWVSE